MAPDLVDAATRRTDDSVKILKAVNKQGLSGSRIFQATAISHWFSVTGLIQRILD
jgi:hypothetical protein